MASVQHLQKIIVYDVENEHKYQSVYRSATLLGLLVGIVLEVPTMSTNFILVSYRASSTDAGNSEAYITRILLTFGFCWTMPILFFAILVLGYLRQQHRLRFNASNDDSSEESEDIIYSAATCCHDVTDEDTSDMYTSLVQIEIRFVASAMIGICASWGITGIFLGLKRIVLNSMIASVIALCLCHFALKWTLAIKRANQLQNKSKLDYSYVAIV
jgi:hypothetical protein